MRAAVQRWFGKENPVLAHPRWAHAARYRCTKITGDALLVRRHQAAPGHCIPLERI